MSPPTAHFDQSFDAIELHDAPSRQAIEHAMAMCGPAAGQDGPGFYLIDDAGGRFTVDRDFGVVSLRDEALLARESGEIHTARLKVIEASGLSYELDLRLRISGLIPQMVGHEGEASALLGVGAVQATSPSPPPRPWVRFSPATAGAPRHPLPRKPARFGGLIPEHIDLAVSHPLRLVHTDAVIAPAGETAIWPD